MNRGDASAFRPGRLLVWLGLLCALTLGRLLVAGFAPLSADETYYWVWSRALAPGFLDHPPMVALWIRLGTLLCGDGALGIRLLGPISAAAGTVLLGVAAADFGAVDPAARLRRAVIAGTLLNATLILAAGSVTMTPDTPLLFFWTAALFALGRLLRTGRALWWPVAGIALGLALDSKYTVVLPGAGLAGWLVFTRAGRFWLRTPWPWIALLLALLVFAPVLDWNSAHGWASFLKQGGRTGDWHPGRALRYLGELLGGQLGLATPWVFALVVLGLGRAVRAGRRGDAGAALLCWVTLLPVCVFLEHALGDRVQANWPGLLYPAAILAAACFAQAGWRGASLLGFTLAVPLYLQAAASPFSLPRQLDVTLQRLAGWPALAAQVASAGPGFIAADEYGLAAELAHALPGREVIGAEPRWRLFDLPHPALAGRDGMLVRDARRTDAPDSALFELRGAPIALTRGRAGRVAERFLVWPVRVRPVLAPAAQRELARLPEPH